RNFASPQQKINGAIGMIVGPQDNRIALLLIRGPEQGCWNKQRDEGDNAEPVIAVQAYFLIARRPPLVELVRRQARQGADINEKANGHADAGGGKAVMPAQLLAEGPAYERCEKRADIDADIKDRIGTIAARIAGPIEAADLG